VRGLVFASGRIGLGREQVCREGRGLKASDSFAVEVYADGKEASAMNTQRRIAEHSIGQRKNK